MIKLNLVMMQMKFRLDYQGDHLGGIPGNVINIETGENLGEWVELER